MMKFFSAIAFILVSYHSYAQQSKGFTLLSKWNNPALPTVDSVNIWSDLTCWHDSSTGKEYVIAGSTDSIYFFDISDPTKIVLCDVEFGVNRKMVNRDYEVYQHYVYCVSDNKDPGALQVFDMAYLPDSVHKVYESAALGRNTHTVFVDAKSKRLYMGTNRFPTFNSAMDILSLEDPENPVFLSRLNVPVGITGQPVFKTVHEMFVRNDTAYCSVEYSGLFIFDLRDLSKQKLIGTISNYPGNGYNHSSWLNRNGKKIMFTDEVPAGLEIKIFDISDPGNPRLESSFNSHPGATPHNAYWIGDFAYVSSYEDGVYVYDIGEPSHPFVAAWYDTYPQNPAGQYNGYFGCWGVYPFLPSGNIVASDRSNGIFVLKPDSGLLHVRESLHEKGISLYPNPVKERLRINNLVSSYSYQITDIKGVLVKNGSLNEGSPGIDLGDFDRGLYFIRISNEKESITRKIIKE